MKRPLVLIATLPLFLLACGSDDGDSASGGDAADFCTFAKAADSSGDAASDALDAGDPAGIEAAFTAALADAEKAAELAPPEIADVVDTVVDGQTRIVAVLERNDWDLTAALSDDEFQSLATDETFENASNDLDEFLETECGIPADGSASTEDTTASDSDEGSTGTIDLGNGDAAAAIDQFLSLYEIGSGTKLTDDQRACLKDELDGELSSEDLSAVANGGEPSNDVAMALGLAFINCDVVTG
jgi:hypothetical protein